VYSIDQDTGEPTLIQNIDTRGMRPQTHVPDEKERGAADVFPAHDDNLLLSSIFLTFFLCAHKVLFYMRAGRFLSARRSPQAHLPPTVGVA